MPRTRYSCSKDQTEQEEGEELTKNLKRSTNEQITSSERKRLIKCLERRKVSSASASALSIAPQKICDRPTGAKLKCQGGQGRQQPHFNSFLRQGGGCRRSKHAYKFARHSIILHGGMCESRRGFVYGTLNSWLGTIICPA